MVFNPYWQELYPPQDDFRTACLPLTIEEDFPLIKSGYSACRGHLSAVYIFELNGEIHEDNLALLDGVDYARIRRIQWKVHWNDINGNKLAEAVILFERR